MENSTSIKQSIGKYRWVICGLVFFATTVNYLDRQVISLLKSDYLEPQFGWKESDYANIVTVFQIAYALGMVGAGWFIDKIGTKLGYAAALAVWSVAAIGHALSGNTAGFMVARAVLGVSEAGNFPAAIKTVAEWFPKKERALATGIFNSGSNIGAIIAPLTVPLIASMWGWQWAFIITGAVGLLWLVFWFAFYESPEKQEKYESISSEWFPKKERESAFKVYSFGLSIIGIVALFAAPMLVYKYGWWSLTNLAATLAVLWVIIWLFMYALPQRFKKFSKEEHEYIISDVEVSISAITGKEEKIPWSKMLKYKQTWAFVIGKFLTDPVWWFYLFWLPSFLKEQYHMQKTDIAFPIAVVYTMTTFGSILGGWFSSFLIQRGWEVYKARKTAMLVFAIIIVPVVSAQWLGQFNPWFAILIVGLAASAHQAWSANIFTTASDMFPKRAVASITGLGGMAGALGGILVAQSAGKLFDYYKALGHIQTGYYIMFIICGSAYLLAWFISYVILVPKMKPIDL